MQSEWSQFRIKNKSQTVARTALLLSVIFIGLVVLVFSGGNFFSGNWALAFISFFLTISTWVVAWMFGIRARQMNKLLQGEQLIDQWRMDESTRRLFAAENGRIQKEKSFVLIRITGILFLLIGAFFFFQTEKDDRWLFVLIMGSVFAIVAFASWFFPRWYEYRNRKGDGFVLLGKHCIYVNGYFHQWSFALSGLRKLEAIDHPFRGVFIQYEYTDRTGKNVFDLKIPVSEDKDPREIIELFFRQRKK